MNRRRSFLVTTSRAAAMLGAAGWFKHAHAQDTAISPKHITIGSSMPLTGPLGNAGVDHSASVQAAFAEINRSGGINGRELRWVVQDDAYVPARTAENIKKMLDANTAFALMSVIGTPNVASFLPQTEKAGVVLVGPITGAVTLRRPELRHVFHVRPSYEDETQVLVDQLARMGLSRVAVVFLDNPFGKEVLASAQSAFAKASLQATAAVPLAFDGSNVKAAVDAVVESKANVVFLGTTGSASTQLVLGLRERAQGLPILGLSVAYTQIKQLGNQVAGLGVASLFPNQRSVKYNVVRNYLASMEAAKLKAESDLGLESWINAQLLAEGLRRAGRDLTREKLRSALSGIRSLDLDEVQLGFAGAPPYVASKKVSLAIFDANGMARA
jgi:branched-chain amino acid transport system substrate-binding protein